VLKIGVVAGVALLASVATAREIHWSSEIALEMGFWGATAAMEKYDKPSEGRSDFPTQVFDESARDIVHGAGATLRYSKRERSASTVSDVTIAGLLFSTGTAGLGSGEVQWAGRTMTMAHGLAINNFASTLAKHGFRRIRPKAAHAEGGPQPEGDDIKSFPSAHASNAFTAATAFYLLYPESSPWLKGGFFTAAAVVAYARMVADRHYLTDVLVGGGVGALSAIASFRLFESSDSAWSLNSDGASLSAQYCF
jgi:membrane-associated phospholipid phosphatase